MKYSRCSKRNLFGLMEYLFKDDSIEPRDLRSALVASLMFSEEIMASLFDLSDKEVDSFKEEHAAFICNFLKRREENRNGTT